MNTPITRAFRRIGLAVLAGALLAGCGGQPVATPTVAPPTATAPSATAPSATAPLPTGTPSGRTGEEAAIENMIDRYNEALLARDWPTACGLAAPATIDKLLQNVRSRGADVGNCQEAFTAIYALPDAATMVDGISRTTEVEKVQVSGDRATISWSATLNGQRTSVQSAAIRVDGKWLLLDTSD